MNVSKIKGLKYPNEYFIKYFFKRGLHEGDKKSCIEFGCSNGNNLMLPYQYGHNVIGVDIDTQLIEYANENFQHFDQINEYSFFDEDMIAFIQEKQNIKADLFLLPNIISYLTKDELIKFLELSKKNNIYKKGADFFVSTRSVKDFRFARGEKIGENSYRLKDDITSENGAVCTCYREYELIDIFREYLGLYEFEIFSVDVQNLHSNLPVLNSDIVIWGKIG